MEPNQTNPKGQAEQQNRENDGKQQDPKRKELPEIEGRSGKEQQQNPFQKSDAKKTQEPVQSGAEYEKEEGAEESRNENREQEEEESDDSNRAL